VSNLFSPKFSTIHGHLARGTSDNTSFGFQILFKYCSDLRIISLYAVLGAELQGFSKVDSVFHSGIHVCLLTSFIIHPRTQRTEDNFIVTLYSSPLTRQTRARKGRNLGFRPLPAGKGCRLQHRHASIVASRSLSAMNHFHIESILVPAKLIYWLTHLHTSSCGPEQIVSLCLTALLPHSSPIPIVD
jgi:hypothetical protein